MNIWENRSIIDMDDEEWKDLQGYVGFYQISNMGRLKSLRRATPNPIHGTIIRKEKILSQHLKKGYLTSSVFIEGIKKFVLPHILVAIAFVPNPENKPEVNHKKGVKTDNRATELEWSTESENMKHSYDIGTHKVMTCEDHPLATISNKTVMLIFNSSLTIYELSKIHNVSQNIVWSIKSGKSWGNLTGKSYKNQYHRTPPDIVLSIFNSKEGTKSLAEKHGLSRVTIKQIRSGRTYSNLTNKK